MQWFRHYAGLARHPKLVAVAAKSGKPLERVVWVWCAFLESCCEADAADTELDVDEAAYLLRCEPGDITAIIDQMETVGLLENGRAATWERRNFKSDRDPTNAERQKRYRERKRNSGVTDSNVTQTVTPSVTETDSNAPDSESDTESESEKKAAAPRAREPDADGGDQGIVERFLTLRARHWPQQQPCLTPRVTLDTQAQQLLAHGYPAELVIEHLEAEMPRVAEKGRSPPGSLRFFANSLNDALRRHEEGVGHVNGAGGTVDSRTERHRRIKERIRKNGNTG